MAFEDVRRRIWGKIEMYFVKRVLIE